MKVFLILSMLYLSSNTSAKNTVNNVLEQFAWEKRQLIVFTPDTNHNEYKKYNQFLKLHKLAFDERYLHSWHVINNDTVKLDTEIVTNVTNQEFRDSYQVNNNDFRIILIGYDQGEKLRLKQSDLDLIFLKIDQMPMRIQEMQNNN